MDRRTCASLSPCLADAFLAGAWDAAALATRAGQVLEPRPPWIALLVRRVLGAYERAPADRPRELAGYIALQLEQIAVPTTASPPRVRRWLVAELAMVKRPWPVPELASLGAVASHLEVSDGQLAWLADVRGLERTVADEKLRHYADDLTFSGSSRLLHQGERIRATVATIAREEGFAVNTRKSAVTTRAARQRVCGIVVNEHPNVARHEYDQLKATLHNAARRGPSGENRAGVPDFRAHLLGRIAWVESLHPGRGAKLRSAFARIAWGRDHV